MNWDEILRKSWEHIRKQRYLWWLGILAVLTEGGSSWGSTGGSSGSGWTTSDTQEMGRAAESVGRWVGENLMAIAVILVALFLIFLIVLYISYSARAGLIHSVNFLESEGEKKITFGQAFQAGERYFWRMLGATILIALLIFAAILILLALGIGLFALAITISEWLIIIMLGYLFVVILAVAILAIYLNIILNLAYRNLVIKNSGVIVSLRAGRELLHHNFDKIVLAWLIQLAINIFVAMALLLGIVIAGLALVVIGVGIYFAGGWLGVGIFAAVAILLIILAFWAIGGLVNAYFSTFWTLVWRELVYNK